MKDRRIPCTECRKQRRKCIRTDSAKPCSRCEKLDKVCINPDNTLIDPNNEVDRLSEQVEQLSLTIKRFENEIRTFKENGLSNDEPLPPSLIENLYYQWKVKINDGYFSIETGIQYLSDLLPYQPSISYLSPISSNSSEEFWTEGRNGILIRFKTQDYGSLYGLTGKILAKCLKKRILESSAHLTLDLASFGSYMIMDRLIDIYFHCHNISNGWLHEATFRKKYRKVKSPFNDLVCVSLCSYVCATPCAHLDFTARQRRIMSDFFYSKIKDVLLDQFDDPDKKLENLLVINLLFPYMHMTLNFSEYDYYVTMAYHISLDLKNYYQDVKTHSTVDYVIFTRLFSSIYCVRVVLDCVAGKMITRQPLPFPRLEVFPDEPEETKKFIQSQDWTITIYDHPFIDTLLEQVHLIYIGSTCTVSFETILRLDEVMLEYRRTIPKQWDICKDVYDEEQCRRAIDGSFDYFAIFTFIQFHVIVLTFYGTFLQPVALNNESDDLLNIVRQHALERSRKATRLVLYGMEKLSQLEPRPPCHYQLAAIWSLFFVFDTLVLQCGLPADNIASEAREMFQSCLDIISRIRQVKENDIPSRIQIDKNDIKEFIRSGKADINYYNKFPDPWYALMCDVSRFL
ncbi:hypothetical protein G6F37_007965 [Rhizopus arrhizus]|nr:hypothetical protein G6F38_011266 [Rhizopus arrhizus]KAG1156053.1 hypothetical protein G6F37_007965 [Rhizopus arrhizus]